MNKNALRNANLVHLLPEDFRGAALQNLRPLDFPRGAFAAKDPERPASLTSAPLKAPIPFDELLFSASVVPARGGRFTSEVKARTPAGWSRWYSLGRFGAGGAASVKGQADRFGRMDTDTLSLRAKATHFRYRITLYPGRGPGAIRLAAAAFTDTKAPFRPGPAARAAAAELRVPAFSQMTQRTPRAKDLCSPTSLAMALTYAGLRTSPLRAAAAVRDSAEDIFGNWYMNAAYAGARGLGLAGPA